jgi:DNA polymerase I
MQRRQAVALLEAITPDGRIYAQYNPLGAVSGRFSSSGPNLQQINRAGAMRGAFCALPGRVLVILDYSQLELRVAALLSRDGTMLTAFMAGEDLHVQTASIVLRKSLEEVTKGDRQTAKAVNFGLLFGQRAKGLVAYARANYGVVLTLEQAEQIRRRFFAHCQGLAHWHAQAQLHAPFVLEGRTLLGRRRLPTPDADDWDKFQLLINHPVQGTAADGYKRALVRLHAELPPGVLIIGCVHDEVILEAPETLGVTVKEWARKVMVEEMGAILPGVPIEVEGKVCQNWGQKS